MPEKLASLLGWMATRTRNASSAFSSRDWLKMDSKSAWSNCAQWFGMPRRTMYYRAPRRHRRWLCRPSQPFKYAKKNTHHPSAPAHSSLRLVLSRMRSAPQKTERSGAPHRAAFDENMSAIFFSELGMATPAFGSWNPRRWSRRDDWPNVDGD